MLSVVMAASLATGRADSSSGTADTRAEEVKAGDTKDNGGTGMGSKDTQATPGEWVTLTAVNGYAPEDPHGQYIHQYAGEFMKENPDIKMEVQAIASGDIYTELAATAASPDDLPIMFFTSTDQAPTLYDLGLAEDLNNWMDKEAIDGLANGVIDTCTTDGRMTYYPVAIQPQAVVYRVDRFEEAELRVPAIQDEFVDCAEALTRDTGGDRRVGRWGLSMVGSNNSSEQSHFTSYLWNNEYELAYQKDGLDEWKTSITTSPASVDVFSKWADMNNVEDVVPTGIIEVDYPTTADCFAMGYTSMFLTGLNALGVAYTNDPELKGKLGSFKLPGEHSSTMLRVEGYIITAKSADAEGAATTKYLAFFTSHDKDMKFQESDGRVPSATEGQKVSYITGDDYAGLLKQTEDSCRPILAFTGTSGLKNALGNAYATIFSNEKTNGQAAEQLVKDLNQLLKGYS